ncbi:MAG: amino acid ABC transporter ATP-binding protein [Rhizobiales bacterium]|nr:amino acid ABC transporter ATP-binding protein [Hyphomicrobiales bacterium]
MSLVAVRKVSKNFGAHMVLDGIDLEVDAGEVVAIIGRSGSGKSTLLRCINGLEPVDRGEIRVNGRLVTRRRADLRKLHGEVGIVFQSLNLFPHLSVERNITLGLTVGKKIPLAEAKRLARATLAEVDLLDKIDAYPAHLSGGQQQRVAIARALAMQPALLLFDEITSALDPEMISEVVRVLERLARLGKTMIIVTHEMGFARSAATTLVFMHQGRVWERGIPRQLLNAPRTPELAAFLSAFMRADPMTGA